MTIKELKDFLDGKSDTEVVVAILWTEADVKSLDSTLTDDEVKQVLLEAAKRYDCEHGITWDILEDLIQDVKEGIVL